MMKVTVCFGNVRVVVPCGNGEILISELIDKAIMRYKKASGKSKDHYVNIHTLKVQKDGGILDNDDLLIDVADDREQILALFEESGGHMPHNGGDGTSNSSMGTSSPDIFQNGDTPNYGLHNDISKYPPMDSNDVIITPSDLAAPTSLKVLSVRRGSESNLTNIGTTVTSQHDTDDSQESPRDVPKPAPRTIGAKRWPPVLVDNNRHSPIISRDSPSNHSLKSEDSDKPRPPTSIGADQIETSAFSRFARDSTRQSLGSNHPALSKWLDAQDSVEYDHTLENEDSYGRREPLGENHIEDNRLPSNYSHPDTPLYSVVRKTGNEKSEHEMLVTIKNTGGPLGIHVVPDINKNGRDVGLIIQGIEPGGKIAQDGRLSEQDRIIEINETSLCDVNFTQAQDVFRRALLTGEIRLRVVKNKVPPLPEGPPPTLPKPKTGPRNAQNNTRQSSMITDEEQKEIMIDNRPCVPGSPKKVPPAIPARDPSTTLSNTGSLNRKEKYLTANTRKIGKKIHIQLTKGAQGLGFSVTTRDNQTGESNPIYIKNILPKGAAVTDGRLKSGDRLLEVNGIEMTGKPQSDAVQILRNTRQGSVVNLVVSRQEAVESSQFTVPRELNSANTVPDSTDPLLQPPEKVGDEDKIVTLGNNHKEVLTFNIPLNDTGSAGLGVSVKGKTMSNEQGNQDLGIFIKAIINGGAASKDGRLHVNDQLVSVNNESLIGKTNGEAMETLRRAMLRDDATPGHINIVVARKPGGMTSGFMSPSFAEDLDLNKTFHMGETHSDTVRSDGAGSQRSDATSSGNDTESARSTTETENSDQTVIHRDDIIRQLQDSVSTDNNQFVQQRNELNQSNNNQSKGQSNVLGVTLNSAPHPQFPNVMMRNGKNTYSTSSNNGGSSSVTINAPSGETVMIEDDQSPPREHSVSSRSGRPHSSIGIGQPGLQLASGTQNDEVFDSGAPQPPEWLQQWEQRNRSQSDSTDIQSPMMVEDPFSREGFGRQSINEKRRGHFKDPSQSEVYQKAKTAKEEKADIRKRAKSFQEGNVPTDDIGPNLGMKKSSSLESLQAMVEEVNKDQDPSSPNYKAPNLVVRGRGCNESFRAAVDRSYQNAEIENMDPVEEESSEGGSIRQHSSERSSISSHDSDSKKKNRKSGLFKGIGHMFKFGKNRKSLEDRVPRTPAAELHQKREVERLKQEQLEKLKARQQAQDEQQRIQEQYRKLQEKQKQEQYRKSQMEQQHYYQPPPRPPHYSQQTHHQHPHQDLQERHSSPPGVPQSRAEKIQQLRMEHQRRHKERQGHYPLDEKEEQYEQQLSMLEKKLPLAPPGRHFIYPSNSGDQFELPPRQYNRVPEKREVSEKMCSHYQNYDEIQEQFKRRDYYQEKYRQHQQQLQKQQAYNNSNESRSNNQLYDSPLRTTTPSSSSARENVNRVNPAGQSSRGNSSVGQGSGSNLSQNRAYSANNSINNQKPPTIPQKQYNLTGSTTPKYNNNDFGSYAKLNYDDYDDPRNAYTGQGQYGMFHRHMNSGEDIIMSNSAQV